MRYTFPCMTYSKLSAREGPVSVGLYSPSSGVPSSLSVLARTIRNLSPVKHSTFLFFCPSHSKQNHCFYRDTLIITHILGSYIKYSSSNYKRTLKNQAYDLFVFFPLNSVDHEALHLIIIHQHISWKQSTNKNHVTFNDFLLCTKCIWTYWVYTVICW